VPSGNPQKEKLSGGYVGGYLQAFAIADSLDSITGVIMGTFLFKWALWTDGGDNSQKNVITYWEVAKGT
jgi:hypothetical protein